MVLHPLPSPATQGILFYMFPDIADLLDFYNTPLGGVTKRLLRRKLLELWPTLASDTVVGLGYAAPLLRPYQEQTPRTFAVMPAQQGIVAWPREGAYRSVLSLESQLPFADNSIDTMILLHAVENTDNLQLMLQEVWRVLAGNGKLLMIVPNRRGIWAHLERTPFGQGHPFSMRQAKRLLRAHQFTPIRFASALYMPPFTGRVSLRAAAAWEKIGQRWFPSFAGVLLIEARKQLYAPIPAYKPAVVKPMLRGLKARVPVASSSVQNRE